MPRKKHKRKASQVANNTNKKTKQEKGTAPDGDSSANDSMSTDNEEGSPSAGELPGSDTGDSNDNPEYYIQGYLL